MGLFRRMGSDMTGISGSRTPPRESRSRSPGKNNVSISVEHRETSRQDGSSRYRPKPEVDDTVQCLVLEEAFKMSKMQLRMSFDSVLAKFNDKQSIKEMKEPPLFAEMKEQLKETYDQLARHAT